MDIQEQNNGSRSTNAASVGGPPIRNSHRLLKTFIALGMAVSLLALVGELYWKSLNRYEQSAALSRTVGRKKLVWDLRASNSADLLGKPESTIDMAGHIEWIWENAYDVHILLPNGRELKTDALLVTAGINKNEIKSIHINGGTELSPADMRAKIIEEVRLMRPNRNSDGTDGVESVERWYTNPAKYQSAGWILRGRPEVSASIRDVSGSYIVQYDFSWY